MIVLLCALASCSPARSGSEAERNVIADDPVAESAAFAPIDAAVGRLMASHGVPGASLAMARDGRMVLARGYGWADTVARIRVRTDHRFRVASVSKPVTAVAVLKLVEQGALNLDDRAFDLLAVSAAGGAPLDPRIGEITVRQLLQHRAGFDRSEGLDPTLTPGAVAERLDVEPPVNVDQIIAFMLGLPLDFDPDSRAAYSNFGYAVLGRLVEDVTGQPYEVWVREEVLAPVGAGGMVLAAAFPEERPPNEVRYYHPPPPSLVPAIPPRTDHVPVPDGGFDLGVMAAHGGWTATASELVRFALAVDGEDEPPDILSSDGVGQMLAPPPGPLPDSAYYAMGWIVEPAHDNGDEPRWWHPGDLPGSTALLVASGPTVWAVLLNRSPWSRTAHQETMDAIEGALLEVFGVGEEVP